MLGNSDNHGLPPFKSFVRLQNDGKKDQRVVAQANEVPAASGLAELKFDRPKEKPEQPYDTPEAADSSFKKPGPAAGPFKAHLGDRSVMTYYWYRIWVQGESRLTGSGNDAIGKTPHSGHCGQSQSLPALQPLTHR